MTCTQAPDSRTRSPRLGFPMPEPIFQPLRTNPTIPALEREILARWETEGTFEKLREQNRGGPKFSFIDGPVTANKSARRPHGLGPDAEGRLPALQGARAASTSATRTASTARASGSRSASSASSGSTRSARSRSTASRSSRASAATSSCRSSDGADARLDAARPVDGLGQRLLHVQRHEHRVHLAVPQDRPRARLALHGPPLDRVVPALRHVDLAARADAGERLRRIAPTRRSTSASRCSTGRGESLVIWTTTPWTLPANVAAAVNPDAEYGRRDERRVGRGRALSRRDVRGARARRASSSARRYQRPVRRARRPARVEHRVIPWDEVSLDEGTGIVHIAPGCGGEDFELSRVHDLPVLTPVDESGRFYDELRLAARAVDDRGGGADHRQPRGEGRPRRGRAARAPLSRVLALPHAADLPDRRRLVHLRRRDLRQPMLDANATVEWTPEYMGKRMDDWLRNMGDWNISRRRYYGLPLPFYPCACGHLNVIGSRAELEERARRRARPARGAAPAVDRPRSRSAARSAASRSSASRRSATSGSTPASSRSRRSAGRTRSGSTRATRPAPRAG